MTRWIVLLVLGVTAARGAAPDRGLVVAERVAKLTRDSSWKLVRSVPIGFTTYHPQGMVKIGDTLYVSSVEVRVPTRRLPQNVDGHDRDAGEGVGHLFKIDMAGNRSPIFRSEKAPSTIPAASITTGRTSGSRWPSIGRTVDRLFIASILKP